MKLLTAALCLAVMTLPAISEPLTFKEARKALPRAKAKPVITVFEEVVPAADKAQLEGARQKLKDVLKTMGQSVPSYGAVAISPDEGLFVEWLNGAGQFHSLASARQAALSYCNDKRKRSSAKCALVVEVSPKGAKADAPISLSGPANAALRGAYRKLQAPKAFAISDKTGNFGFERGDGGRALEACRRAGDGASDCRIVVAD